MLKELARAKQFPSQERMTCSFGFIIMTFCQLIRFTLIECTDAFNLWFMNPKTALQNLNLNVVFVFSVAAVVPFLPIKKEKGWVFGFQRFIV
jgi:hypothetical protein